MPPKTDADKEKKKKTKAKEKVAEVSDVPAESEVLDSATHSSVIDNDDPSMRRLFKLVNNPNEDIALLAQLAANVPPLVEESEDVTIKNGQLIFRRALEQGKVLEGEAKATSKTSAPLLESAAGNEFFGAEVMELGKRLLHRLTAESVGGNKHIHFASCECIIYMFCVDFLLTNIS